jgi:three-Cys-motif partner protein
MPRLSDSNPEKWLYSPHVRVKHEVLTRYLDPWVTIMGSNPYLAYVDGFAGRGRYFPGNQPGSPLLAFDVILDSLQQKRHHIRRIDCHLVEPDADNMSNLRAELSRHRADNHSVIRIHYHKSRFGEAIDTILHSLNRDQYGSIAQPSFFFLDPFGYDDPTMDTVERILRLPKSEAFVNYMFDFVNWATGMSNLELGRTLDSLHGNPNWRECTPASGDERERCLRENYRRELKRRGAAYVIPFRMGQDAADRTLYYLFHASGHIKAARVMKDAMVKAGSPGHVGYAGEARHRLRPLFDADASMLPSLIRRVLQDRPLTFDQIIAASIEESGTCIDKHYRDCIKKMENEEEVTIERQTSKTRRGLSGADLVSLQKPR